MSRMLCITTLFTLLVSTTLVVSAQEEGSQDPFTEDPPAATGTDEAAAEPTPGEQPVAEEKTADERIEQATDQIGEVAETTQKKVSEFAEQVDQDERAQEAKAGILKPIYMLAEYCSFPTFHWVAFTLMVAGVIGFALQLVLGKLVVLANRGFSLKEILSDGIVLAISLVGLVLTTQAATENSTFTQSAFAVLSATAVGGLLGFVLYLWGQAQEVEAARGRGKES